MKASVLGTNYPRVFHKPAVLEQKPRVFGEAAVLYRKSPGFFRAALFCPGFLKGRCSGRTEPASPKPGNFSNFFNFPEISKKMHEKPPPIFPRMNEKFHFGKLLAIIPSFLGSPKKRNAKKIHILYIYVSPQIVYINFCQDARQNKCLHALP